MQPSPAEYCRNLLYLQFILFFTVFYQNKRSKSKIRSAGWKINFCLPKVRYDNEIERADNKYGISWIIQKYITNFIVLSLYIDYNTHQNY